ncbi:MAG: MATE family efflux transporter, partial [Lachnospiraceae bacterium]|nr:MATE family efflux transporter [Lachnospiraceae bacterium]
VRGAAYATVIATGISMLLCLFFIAKKYPILRFHTKYVGKNMSYAKELLSTGLSMGFMIVVTSIGTVALQGAVNSLGETIIAAQISARKIDDIFMWPLGSLALATSTFTSQNFGAGQYKRVQDGIKGGIHLALIWSVFSIVVLFSFGGLLIPLVSGSRNADILNAAKMYIRINSAFFPALCILLILRSSLQGLGRKLMPNIGSIIEMVLKFGSVNLIAAGLGYFGVCILEPAVWIICTPLLAWNYRKTISYIMKTSVHANEKSIGNAY